MASGQDQASAKTPRTDRGRRTMRKLLDAATSEFGEKGFHEASISTITARAGVALGSFYTYFDSKDAIFRALVRDLSDSVRVRAGEALEHPQSALAAEQAALSAFLAFAKEHKEIYRIIDEAEFVDPESYRRHYETTAARIAERLSAGKQSGELRADLGEAEAWAIMGMNVFLGLRYAIWTQPGEDPDAVAETANRLLAKGITATQ